MAVVVSEVKKVRSFTLTEETHSDDIMSPIVIEAKDCPDNQGNDHFINLDDDCGNGFIISLEMLKKIVELFDTSVIKETPNTAVKKVATKRKK